MIEKLKKIMNCLLVVVISITSIPMTNVSALTLDDTLTKDTSYHFQSATVKWNDWSKWVNAPEYPIKRTSDGAYVYCIEAHIEFKDGQVVHGYTDEHSQLILSNLTRDELRRIKLYSYYGYGYGNHTDMDWYAATQYLIWEITEKEMAPWPVADGDSTLTRIDRYDAKMNEIRNLVDKHGDTVSFNNQEITLKPNESIRLTDTNGVLKNFKVPESNVNADFSIDGNDLVVTAKHPFEGDIVLEAKENPNPPMIYATENQKCISIGDPTYLSGKIRLNVMTPFEFEKVFGDNDAGIYSPEEGAVFELYNEQGNLVIRFTSNEFGKASTYLRYGNYTLRQVESKDKSYKFIDDVRFTVDGSKSKISLYLKNEKIKSDLVFTKKDFSTDETLPNTKIQIYNADTDELVYEGVTDEDGQIIIKGLKYGRYYIIESEAPEGYELNPERMYFEILEDGKVIKVTMKDKKIEDEPEQPEEPSEPEKPVEPDQPKEERIIEVPNTLANTNFAALPISMLIAGSIILIANKKNKKNKKFNID